MTVPTHNHVGVLILRCWTEGEPPTGLRVRIIATDDLATTEWPVAVVTDAVAAGAAVSAWLQAFVVGRGE
jgi:hypothetical protein